MGDIFLKFPSLFQCYVMKNLAQSCISLLVSQQGVHEPKKKRKSIVSAIQTNLIGSEKRGDFYRLNFLS